MHAFHFHIVSICGKGEHWLVRPSYPTVNFENMLGGRFLLQFLLVGMALFLFDTFSIAPLFATGASSVKVCLLYTSPSPRD